MLLVGVASLVPLCASAPMTCGGCQGLLVATKMLDDDAVVQCFRWLGRFRGYEFAAEAYFSSHY